MKLMLAATLLVTACGGGNSGNISSQATSSAVPSSTPATATATAGSSSTSLPVSPPLGVLVGSQAASSYTVSLVGVDGRVVASAEASTPPITSCASAAAAPYPLPVSESNSRAYFMDAQGVVHYLGPTGDTGRATSVPAATKSQRSTFAVSPDDRRIAVVVATYTATQATTRLYIEDLAGGGHHLNLFSETGARSLWAVGWHGTNNLVVAMVPSCTLGGGPFCCGMQELHVVDPATATRRFTIGNVNCPPVNSPSPAGVICENPPSATVLSWTAGKVRTYTIQGPVGAYLSPSGSNVAFVDNVGTTFTSGGSALAGLFACTWIDDTHVMSGGDAQHQPLVGDVISGGIVPVAAAGGCGGRLPGGL